jgi:hypothetical protein
VDLSTGGAAVTILADSTLAAGAAVSLELPAARSLVTVPATIVSQDEETFGAFMLRLQFDECGDDLRAIVEELATEFRKRQASIFRGRM